MKTKTWLAGRLLVLCWACAVAALIAGCGDSDAPTDAGGMTLDAGPAVSTAPTSPEAAARGFKLFYKERVHRVLLAYNRFQLFGDSAFGTTISRASVAKNGNEYEVVAGPHPNSLIGTSVFATYHAYKVLRTRETELSLLRMLEGLVFYEEVSGHPGLTPREALPGWTRVMDGVAGTVTRDRLGEPVRHPSPPGRELEAEMLETFYRDVRFTYRENPEEYFFSFMPAARTSTYAVSYSQPELPHFLRMFECCESFFRTPDEHKWGGAYWGNHNSRDNLPDLGLGFVAAHLAAADEGASDAVRASARRAIKGGKRIGDLIFEHGGVMMTVDEHNPYDTLVVSGEVRPHGLPENEDLGSLANCPNAYLARALSSDGLGLPAPELPVPGAVDVVTMVREGNIDCEEVANPTCAGLDDGFCGLTWGEFDQLTVAGQPALDFITKLEAASPGTAERLLFRFQDDFDDIVEAMVALVFYAKATGDEELARESRRTEKEMSDLMRQFAEIIWGDRVPERTAVQRYEAAIFDALAGVETNLDDLADFVTEDTRLADIEALLEMEDTVPDALKTDAELREDVESALDGLATEIHASGRGEAIVQRYRDVWGDEIPVRRKGNGYEAKRVGGDWQPAEVPRHELVPTLLLMQALPICDSSPDVLDCTWARLGCQRPDLDGDGTVDAADRSRFKAAFKKDRACTDADDFCEGADLDHSGVLDELDEAFMQAADGCHYEK